jgi:hypothetical protein
MNACTKQAGKRIEFSVKILLNPKYQIRFFYNSPKRVANQLKRCSLFDTYR